jgi:hypothetical protein
MVWKIGGKCELRILPTFAFHHSSNLSFLSGRYAQEAAVQFRILSARAAMRHAFAFFCVSLFLASSGWAYNFNNPAGLYHSYNDLVPWATALEANNPGLVKVVTYGTSYLGNPLIAIEITQNPSINDPGKPEFLFSAGIHAREVIGSEAALAIAQNLINGYNSNDPVYTNMLSQRDVWIIPNQNPDGRLAFEGGLSNDRKNRHWYSGQSTSGSDCGVDLNRNYPHRWGQYSSDSSVTSDTYYGPAMLSEPESNSLWSLVHDTSKFSNLLCAVDFHSGAQTLLPPWCSPNDYSSNEGQIPQPVQDKFNSLVDAIKQKNIARKSQNLLTPTIASTRLGYESYGTLSDSLYEEFSNSTRTTYAMTEELYTGTYIGSSPDRYFSYFNPVTPEKRDAAIQNAVDSAMYLLSDAAFQVPEPSTFALLAIAGLAFLAFARRRL